MAYNYITDLNTNAIYKTTSPEGSKLIQQYVNQVGGMFTFRRSGDTRVESEAPPLTPADIAAANDYGDRVAAQFGPPPPAGAHVPFGFRPLIAPPSAASAHSQPHLYRKGDRVMYQMPDSEWVTGDVVQIHYTIQDVRNGARIQVDSSQEDRLRPYVP